MRYQQFCPLTDRKPDEIIAFRSTGPVAVDQFLNEAIALSRRLPAHRYVINLFEDRYQFLCGFCAAVIAGQCTLMPPNRLKQTLEHLAVAYPDCYIIGETAHTDYEISAGGLANCIPGTSHVQVPKIPSDQLCAIAFTSGSTGSPMPSLKYWETLRTGSIGNAQLLMINTTARVNLLATVPALFNKFETR